MMEQTFGALYISQDILTNNFNTLRLALGATERVSMRLSESRSTGLRESGQIDTRESRLMFLRFHKVGDESIMFEFLDLRLEVLTI